MIETNSSQEIIDNEHLKLLALGYIISGAITALFSLLGLFYALMGLMMSTMVSSAGRSSVRAEELPPEFMGWVLVVTGCVLFVVLVGLAVAKFKAAACLRKRTSRTFCMVVGGITCFGIPYGTCLGVGTFIVLGRQSVVELFNHPT